MPELAAGSLAERRRHGRDHRRTRGFTASTGSIPVRELVIRELDSGHDARPDVGGSTWRCTWGSAFIRKA
jgi:hypothetical protein